MEKEIIKQWEANKFKLENWFKNTKQSEYANCIDIVEALFTYVIEGYNTSEIHIIDDGNYQGTQLFLIHKNICQPSMEDYLITDTFYGSCSGCDTLMAISGYSDELPNEEQVKDYMTLALHLVQKLKRLKD